jgi:tetratricopeptide (TPR) repeat protein
MRLMVFTIVVGLLLPLAAAAQAQPDRAGQAYEQFLLARQLERAGKIDAAIGAYKRAMELAPQSAEIPATLAALYLDQNRGADALNAAEQALKIDQNNTEANRVAGYVYMLKAGGEKSGPASGDAESEYLAKAIHHLELVVDRPDGDSDPNVRAALSRLYLQTGAYTKAIPLLTDLVDREPGWPEGPLMLAEAYAGSADAFERDHRWKDAADAYERAIAVAPRSPELKTRYASVLLNGGGREQAVRARDVLTDLLAARPEDGRALYLMSQAQRRLGDVAAAEATARRVIAQNNKSPWGYYALAEALEERHQYKQIVDTLAPVVADLRPSNQTDRLSLGLLLPHLGFAYQELGQIDKAVQVFQDARRQLPQDPAIAGYLVQAYIAAKKYINAIELADEVRATRPNDLRLARLEAQALRQTGKVDQAVALLQTVVKAHEDDPSAYVALAQLYADADRADEAVKLLRDAQSRFPADDSIPFELGAVFDKQKRFPDAEAAFHEVLARDPDNAAALNYLGYMLAERGERLDESVAFIQKALQLEPDNGSYLDSLGWAYFKADKLDLAEDNLKRAADQMTNNSVIQDHYGDVLFKRGRIEEAIAAWTRALNGDGDSIDRTTIDKKIKSARQKLGRR